jgi:hypothetical protein
VNAFVSDFDLDGDNDLLTAIGIPIANISVLKMYKNLGGGIFDTLEGFSFMGLSSRSFLSDFNNDSLPDALFTLTDNSGLVLFYNQGNFQLGDSTFIPLESYGQYEGLRNCSFADFDGNGYNDIVISRSAQIQLPDNLVLLFNDGNGNFGEDPITNVCHNIINNRKVTLQCYPNPFYDEITFIINQTGNNQDILLDIHNLHGDLVRSFSIGSGNSMVNANIIWDGKNSADEFCQPGVYIASLYTDNTIVKQIKLIKHE